MASPTLISKLKQLNKDTINEHLNAIQKDETPEDPLAAWCDYISLLDTVALATELVYCLLKKCFKKFENHPKYKNDPRFITICMKVAYQDHTRDILYGMHIRGIGVSSAEFYVAWAESCALTTYYGIAKEIFKKGFAANAEPKDLLKKAEQNFHDFMGRQYFDKNLKFCGILDINRTLTPRGLLENDQDIEPAQKKVRLNPRNDAGTIKTIQESPSRVAVKEEMIEHNPEEEMIDNNPEEEMNYLGSWSSAFHLNGSVQKETESSNDIEIGHEIELQIKDFLVHRRVETSDDPLAAWCKQIGILEKSGYQGSELYAYFLEKCYFHFIKKPSPKYKEDERFINICLKLAYLDHLLLFLNRMKMNGIGVSSARLYIALADRYAMNNSFKEAYEIYSNGVTTKAKPEYLLEKAQTNFHAFMGKRIFDEKAEFKSAVNVIGSLNHEVEDPHKLLIKTKDGTVFETKLRYTHKKLSEADFRYEQKFGVRDLQWSILMEKKRINKEGDMCLNFKVVVFRVVDDYGYLKASERAWSCPATFELKLLSQEEPTCETLGKVLPYPDFTRTLEVVFNSAKYNSECINFIPWEEILEPINGFVKDDSIILEIHMKIG